MKVTFQRVVAFYGAALSYLFIPGHRPLASRLQSPEGLVVRALVIVAAMVLISVVALVYLGEPARHRLGGPVGPVSSSGWDHSRP